MRGKPAFSMLGPCPVTRFYFTLLELLITMTLIAILAALLLPALHTVRTRANATHCLGNLRQIGVAAALYLNEFGVYPCALLSGTRIRWMNQLSGTLPETADVFQCPADPAPETVAPDSGTRLSYGISAVNFHGNKNFCFWYPVSPVRIRRPSRTIFLVDTEPGKYYFGSGSNYRTGVEPRHPRLSFSALFADFHVENRTFAESPAQDFDAAGIGLAGTP